MNFREKGGGRSTPKACCKKTQHSFPKVRGCLEIFRKFIQNGTKNAPKESSSLSFLPNQDKTNGKMFAGVGRQIA